MATTGFTNSTNQGRVTKIVETVNLLWKSAASNQASSEEVWALMEPALTAISDLLGTEEPDKPEPAPQTTQEAPRYIQIREMAQEAPLKELTMAMAVFINRIEDEL